MISSIRTNFTYLPQNSPLYLQLLTFYAFCTHGLGIKELDCAQIQIGGQDMKTGTGLFSATFLLIFSAAGASWWDKEYYASLIPFLHYGALICFVLFLLSCIIQESLDSFSELKMVRHDLRAIEQKLESIHYWAEQNAYAAKNTVEATKDVAAEIRDSRN